ncbi:MAG: hypothetical protein R3F17_04325 [Planctomycetota bacterium]
MALFSAEPEFRRLCQRGLTVLPPASQVHHEGEPLADGWRLRPFPSTTRPLVLDGLAQDLAEPFPALSYRYVVLEWQGEIVQGTGEPPVLRWKASTKDLPQAEVLGTWLPAPEGGARAHFDLGRQVGWLLAGEIQGLWVPGVAIPPTTVRVLRGPKALPPEVVPRRVEDDWAFDVASTGEDANLASGEWFLDWLDLATMESSGFELGRSQRGRLNAPGLAAWAEQRLEQGGGPLVWRLQVRRDGVALAVARGRRQLTR